MKKSIAVIGSGIAGLTAAYYLSRKHRVTLFEADQRLGGHTHTVQVEWQGEESAIDTGFIVFNDRTYPGFIRLLDELGVDYQPTEMSFSVTNPALGLEYNGNNLNSLFAQRRNLVHAGFWRMLADIARFNRQVRRAAIASPAGTTLGAFLDRQRYGALFIDNYLLPMISAIWSTDLEQTREFPLLFFVRFFENHGLLNLVDRPQWYSIKGGSSSYIEALTKPFRENIHLGSRVESIRRQADTVKVVTAEQEQDFDEVVLACHGDQALQMLAEATADERLILGAFRFTANDVILHTDQRWLPQSSRARASWNYHLRQPGQGRSTVTYYMNRLQCLDKQHDYLVTLNEDIPEESIIGRYQYDHPIFDLESISAQQLWSRISGTDRIHYCGAWWHNGFHEDGVQSALRVCTSLGVTP
ncbi:MAG: FAD-dependent oxidoreductase [Pelovirga sp.]